MLFFSVVALEGEETKSRQLIFSVTFINSLMSPFYFSSINYAAPIFTVLPSVTNHFCCPFLFHLYVFLDELNVAWYSISERIYHPVIQWCSKLVLISILFFMQSNNPFTFFWLLLPIVSLLHGVDQSGTCFLLPLFFPEWLVNLQPSPVHEFWKLFIQICITLHLWTVNFICLHAAHLSGFSNLS